MTAADFGCGAGNFTIPLAKKISDGLIYGLDIQNQPLSSFKGRMLLEKINNIKLIKCDLEQIKGSTLRLESVDWVTIINMLFQMGNKDAIIKEAFRIIKPKGNLLIIDWLAKNNFGPMENRVAKDELIKLVKENGFQFKKEIDAGRYHFGVVFTKT